MTLPAFSPLDLVALNWFALCYFGYGWAVTYGPLSRRHGLVAAIEGRRLAWMREAMRRDVRIVDAQLLTTLAGGTAFFASTTVIVLGGLAAMLGAAENVDQRLRELPLAQPTPLGILELKIVFLMGLVIRAFFKFAWAFRLTHYTSIMIGAMPLAPSTPEEEVACERHAERTARLSGLAALHTNGGMRTVYFAIAGLGWFLNPIIFMIGCGWVVLVVYRREYRSRAFRLVSEV